MSVSAGELDVTLRAVTDEYGAAMAEAIQTAEKLGVASKEVSDAIGGLGASAKSNATSLESMFAGMQNDMALSNFRKEMDAAVKAMEEAEKQPPSLTDKLKKYREEEVQAGRQARFFAGELQELTGMSQGTAGAIAKLGVAFTEGPFGVGVELAKMAVGYLAEQFIEAINEAEKLDKQKFDNIANALKTLEQGAQSATDKLTAMRGFDVEGMKMQAAYDLARNELDGLKSDHAEFSEIPRAMLEEFSENAVGTVSSWGYISSAQAKAFLEATDQVELSRKKLEEYRDAQEAMAKVDPFAKQDDSGKKLGETLDKLLAKGKAVAEQNKTGFDFGGESGKTPMAVLSDPAIDEMAHSAASQASAVEQGKANDRLAAMNARIDAAAREAADEMAEALYEVPKTFGQKAAETTAEVGKALGGAAARVGNIASAFASGGPMAGLAQIGMELLKEMPTFGRMMDKVSKMFEFLGKMLDPVLQAIEPLFNVLLELAAAVFPLMTGMMFLAPLMELLGTAVEAIANIIHEGTASIVGLYNKIVEWLADIADAIGKGDKVRKAKLSLSDGYLTTGEDPADAQREWDAGYAAQLAEEERRRLEEQQEWQRGLDAQRQRELDLAGDAAEDAADSLRDLDDAAQDVGDSLTNVPQGFKVELARFNASTAVVPPSGTAGTGGVGDSYRGGDSTKYEIGTLVVQASSDDVAEAIKQKLQRENLVRTGSPLMSSSPFFAARRT